MSFIEEFIRRLISDSLVLSGDIAGCTLEEVEEISRAQNVSLPQVYKDFLLLAGRGAGDLMAGSDWKFPHPLELKKDCQELVLENGKASSFLDGAVVFLMHHGYMFYYFPAEHVGEHDPPVWMYVEGEQNQPAPADGRFSNFLESQEWEMRNSRRIKELPGITVLPYLKSGE